jgi:YbbR domain-containing protein
MGEDEKMKRKVFLSNLLRNDRFILVLSIVLAIAVWASVAYGAGNEVERTINGVPVTVTLGEYASKTLNMKVLDSQHITASVKVYGRRAVVEQLSAQDISLALDTSTVITPGTHSGLVVKAIKNGSRADYDILSISPSVISLTCDVWAEAVFDVQANISGMKVSDETNMHIGTPLISGGSVSNNTVKISGPKSELDTIHSVVAVVNKKATLSETKVFDGVLKALDANGEEVNISHCVYEGDTADVKVTVPVLMYKKIPLQYQLLHAPVAYNSVKNLVTFTPSYLELWGTQTTIDVFETQLNTLCTFDFDGLSADNLTRELTLNTPEGLKIVNGVESITAKFNLNNLRSKTMSLALTAENVNVLNCPAGYVVKPAENTLNNIVLYGPANAIGHIKAKDLQVTVDVNNETVTGQRSLNCRVTVPEYPGVWVYYGENANGYTVLTTVETAGE